jgi:D-alanyl-D-alanine carboxypeptidase/D-alanyl-D-alanine-endopeptidase (penicillin-binding protein 4)
MKTRSMFSWVITLWTLLLSCSPKAIPPTVSNPVATKAIEASIAEKPKQNPLDSTFTSMEATFQDYTGFVLYDPEEQKTIYSFNGDRYFTPGSNTKIFTFYTCLNLLRDSVPALRYMQVKDSLIFWGTGDPTLLYKNVLPSDKVYNFLKRSKKKLYFSNSNFNTSHFGEGWAWDDYNDYYSTERSPLPIYGNIFWMEINGGKSVLKPKFFKKFGTTGPKKYRPKIERKIENNEFTFYPGRKADTLDIPFHVDAELIANLLADTLNRSVKWINRPMPTNAQVLYSVTPDSLYKVMMQESDNFIAEQLLLVCAGIVSDTLQPEIAIDYALKNFMMDFPDKPLWVDGSGLSRYNLFTPRTIAQLWDKIYKLAPRERLFPLLATGGVSGTIKNWYRGEQPFIFGKTGTLSNNHCLSGFLVAKSGKVLIFSFMNNNYVATTTAIRTEMQLILKDIYEKY